MLSSWHTKHLTPLIIEENYDRYRSSSYRCPRSLSERAWAVVSAFLTKLAEADIRAKSVEPFGL